MLYYYIDHPDPDNNFTVTVVPINIVGPGEPAVSTILITNIIPSSSLPIHSLSSLLSTTVVIPGICYQDHCSVLIYTGNVRVLSISELAIVVNTSSTINTSSIAPINNNGYYIVRHLSPIRLLYSRALM